MKTTYHLRTMKTAGTTTYVVYHNHKKIYATKRFDNLTAYFERENARLAIIGITLEIQGKQI